MSALKGDFISFSFNDVHSSELGIVRTSEGSRFNENLLPTIQDKTVQVPGGDGIYFFGSYYTQRTFNVSIAFDSLTEEQVGRLYSHFGDKQIHKLIFDERPYKVYMAKINGTPQIKTICFEVNGKRIYKGEGTLNFICYYPYAKSNFKYLDDFSNLNIKVKEEGTENEYSYEEFYNNLNEWKDASKMKANADTEGLDQITSSRVKVYNPGDIEADFKMYFRFVNSDPNITLKLVKGSTELTFLKLAKIEKYDGDNIFCINTANNLIEGGYSQELEKGDNFNPSTVQWTGRLYNKFIKSGDFFKIPKCSLSETYSLTYDYSGVLALEYDYQYI